MASLLDKLKSGLKKVGSTISDVASKTLKTISSSASSIVQTISSVATGNVVGAVSGIASIGSNIVDSISSSSSKSNSTGSSSSSELKQFGETLVNKIDSVAINTIENKQVPVTTTYKTYTNKLGLVINNAK